MNLLIIVVFGLIGLLIFIIIFFLSVLSNPVRYEKAQNVLYLLLSCISKKHKNKIAIQETQLKINEFLDESGLTDIGRPLAKIELVSPQEAKVLVENGDMIMKIVPKRKVDQNVISAVLTYVAKGVIPESKPFLSNDLVQSIDLTLAELMLLSKATRVAIELFKKDFLVPTFETYPKIKELNELLKKLDWQGIFTRILLREFALFSIKRWETLTKNETSQEAHKFLDFLYTIASKKEDEEAELSFRGKLINMWVLLISKRGKFLKVGAGPYLQAIDIALADRVERIYILARHDHTDYARYIAMRAERTKRVKKINDMSFKIQYIHLNTATEEVPACCIILEPTYAK